MTFVDIKCLESLLTEGEELSIANEGLGSNIPTIVKETKLQYPSCFKSYEFDKDGNFTKEFKGKIEKFLNDSKWESHFNHILSETLKLPNYSKRIEDYCKKSGQKESDFRISLLEPYFDQNKKIPSNNNMYISFSFYDIDRYDCQGFHQLIFPILKLITKYDMGNEWIVESYDDPTNFCIYRKLSGSELKNLQNIQSSLEAKKNEKNKANAIKAKARKEKDKAQFDEVYEKDSERFYSQSLKDQAMEIVNYFIKVKDRVFYYNRYQVKEGIPSEINRYLKSNPGKDKKITAFDYIQENSGDMMSGKPIKLNLKCFAVTSASSDYKKLDTLYFLLFDRFVSITYNKYLQFKLKNKNWF